MWSDTGPALTHRGGPAVVGKSTDPGPDGEAERGPDHIGCARSRTIGAAYDNNRWGTVNTDNPG
jgi:hypothetical protein